MNYDSCDPNSVPFYRDPDSIPYDDPLGWLCISLMWICIVIGLCVIGSWMVSTHELGPDTNENV